jgi:hypothetical protein
VRSSVGDNVTVITSMLSIWTIITNWKESTLLLLFHSKNTTSQDSNALSRQLFGKDGLMEPRLCWDGVALR